MEWSKVKTILIVLLAVVNLLLGLNIAGQISAQRREETAALQSALTLLRKAGMQFDEQLFFDMPRAPAVLTGARSAAREGAVADALLGSHTVEEAGGGISIYTSRAGRVVFRSGGFFEAELNDGTTAGRLLDAVLKSSAVRGVSAQTTESDGAASAQLLVGGCPVAGAGLECRDTELGASASGRWYFGEEPQNAADTASRTEMAVALLGLEHEGLLEITGLRMVYGQEAALSGVRFVPLWQIDTKNGQILLSSATRREEMIEQK